MNSTTAALPLPANAPARGRAATLKLLLLGLLVLVLQVPVHLIHGLELDRKATREKVVPKALWAEARHAEAFDSYRVVERAMNHDALVAALVLTAFFLFEAMAGLRLHAVHYEIGRAHV